MTNPMYYWQNVLCGKGRFHPKVLIVEPTEKLAELRNIIASKVGIDFIVEKYASNELDALRTQNNVLLRFPSQVQGQERAKDWRNIDYIYTSKEDVEKWLPASLSGVMTIFTFDDFVDEMNAARVLSPQQRVDNFEWAKDHLTTDNASDKLKL